jgi:hypothetical protein
LPRFARLRSRRAVEQGQKNTSTCSTHSGRARARPAPDPSRPTPRRAAPVSPACARAYKSPPKLQPYSPVCSPPHRSQRSPVFALQTACSRHPIPRHHRPACRALPSHARPSEETVHAPVKLLEQVIGLCLAGEASPWSPDFTRPPVNVDRVSLCTIFRFLAHIASTSSRGAHRAV